ncbi:MAG: porin [Verrucomicrobiales bacterium]|nr:porin [Verrucomicrobiales bacterium]
MLIRGVPSAVLTHLVCLSLAPWTVSARADEAAELVELRRQIQVLTDRLVALESNADRAPSVSHTPTLETLDQQLRVLQRQRELDTEAATEKARATPILNLGPGGLAVRTPDTNFVFRLRGYVQADARWFVDDPQSAVNDTFLLRRVRPIFEGTVAERFDYRLMLDFGSGQSSSAANIGWIQDAYVNARWSPGLQVRVGKDKEPVGLERLQSGSNLLFVERAFPTLLVPNRDVGVQVRGEIGSGLLEYQAGVFNGVADGGSGDTDRSDEDKDFAARVFVHPFARTTGFLRGLGVGMAGTYGEQSGPLRGFTSPGQQPVFSFFSGNGSATSPSVAANGVHWRLAPQAWFYHGPFGVLAEYTVSHQDTTHAAGTLSSREALDHQAWQVAASWFITGEENSFRAVTPREPLRFQDSGLGALELAARVSGLNPDHDSFPAFASADQSIASAFEWALGLNWHLNRNVKLQFNYSQTSFEGANKNPLLADGERTLLGRIQFGF